MTAPRWKAEESGSLSRVTQVFMTTSVADCGVRVPSWYPTIGTVSSGPPKTNCGARFESRLPHLSAGFEAGVLMGMPAANQAGTFDRGATCECLLDSF